MITYTCSMKNKKLLTNQQKIARVIGSLSATQSYFLIHTDSMLDPDAKLQAQTDLMLLIYRNHDQLRIGTLVRAFISNVSKASPLMQQVRKTYQNSHHKYKLNFDQYLEKSAMFQLEKGFVLENCETIKDVKRYLRTQCLDGTKLYLKIHHPMDSNQCGAWTLLQNESAFNQGAIEVPFLLKPMNYMLYIPIKFELTIHDIEVLLVKEIQLIFGKIVSQKDLRIKYYFQGEWGQLKKYHILSLCSTDKLEVEVTETMLQLPESQNRNYLILKGEGLNHKILQYQTIKNKKVIDLLTQIEPNRSWNDYGLMISDFALKSFDRIEKAGCMFVRSKVHSKHIAGVIIKEMHVFELELEKIKKIGKVDMKRIVYDQKNNHQHQKTCERQIEKRAQETTLDSFKHDLGGIKPILLYTSELKVCASAKGKGSSPGSIYFVLNEFLRKQNVCSAKDEDFHQWEYLFGCQLLQQLRKIPTITDRILWRGVSYEPVYKLNEVILFKQFTSSSTSESAAKQFADKAMFKIIKSYSGRCIKEFSFYKYEDQILFEPYTYFQVVGIQKYENQQHNSIPCFVLQEVKKQQLPKNIVKIVLWVDDKTGEGKHIWSQIKGLRSTTLMVQLLSTFDLQKWLQRNKDVLLDPAVEIVMITNMTRTQNGQVNGEAGAEAIKIFKRQNPEGDIFVFIGWREAAIKKLQKYLLYPDQRVQVSEYVEDLEDFIKEKCIET